MGGGGGDARVSKAPEDAKVVIGWRAPEKQVVRCKVATNSAWPNVDETSCGGEGVGAEAGWHISVEQ